MSNEASTTTSNCDASVIRGGMGGDLAEVHGFYTVECFGPDGVLKWRDTIDNLVTTLGKNDWLDKYLGNSTGGTVRMGLKGSGSAVVGDTQASHAGWAEPAIYATRPSPSFSAASGGVKATSSATSIAITSGTNTTVAGCFINVGGSATVGDTTGILFSAGDFTGGNKVVSNLDTLNVTYSATLT